MTRIFVTTTLLLVAVIGLISLARNTEGSEPRSPGTSVLRRHGARQPPADSESPSDQAAPRPRRQVPAPAPDFFQGPDSDEVILEDEAEWYLDSGMDGWGYSEECAWLPRGFWANFDYLLWWRQGQRLPALVTTEPNGGVLPGATVLFGEDREGTGVRPGGRFRGGGWLDMDGVMAAEVSFFALGDGRFEFNADSSLYPTLARPFHNLLSDNGPGGFVGPDALQIAAPGISTGSIRVAGNSEVMGGNVLFRGLLSETGRARVDFLAGYQWARIDESLSIFSTTHFGTNRLDVLDSFATQNRFHGGVIGLELVHTYGRWNLEVLGKLGFGNMDQTVMIDGHQTAVVGGSASTSSGGLLAQSTNIGHYQRDAFAVNPEVGITLNCQVTRCFNLATGYSFSYWNRISQPGDQIDRQLAVNPDQPPGPGDPARPAFDFQDSRFYLHGLHAGLEFIY